MFPWREGWASAQVAERKSWLIEDEESRIEKIERETARYPRIRREMGLHLIDTSTKVVVEIGGGPVGTMAGVPCMGLTIVDPLTDEYRKHWPCPYHIRGKGEELPMGDGSVGLVVITNALDHCEYPAKVVSEARRVLRAGGWLAVHNCVNLASVHKHPGHRWNLDEQWFHTMLDPDFEFVHELMWSKDGLRYGWVRYEGKVGQPAIAFLARKVTGYR